MNEHNSFNNNDILVDDNVTALTVDDDIRLNKFNWAAFFGGAIWSVFHKQYLIFIICIIPFGLLIELFTNEFTGNIVGSVLSLAVAIYLGKNGYRMAWIKGILKV